MKNGLKINNIVLNTLMVNLISIYFELLYLFYFFLVVLKDAQSVLLIFILLQRNDIYYLTSKM